MRVYKRGKSWYIDYTYKGKRHRKKVGPSKKVAELALKEVELKIFKGEYMGIFDDKKILFSDFGKEYLAYSKANKAQRSYERDCLSLEKHLIPYFKGKYLFEVTTEDIEHYKAMRLEKVKPSTLNREISCLKHLYTKAIEWGYTKKNPSQGIKKLKESPGRVRYLVPEEIEALLRECVSHIRPIVIMALNTGMRRGEMLNLRWADIDLKERIIIIRKTKNNEQRIIPINDILYDTLQRLPKHFKNDSVFFNEDGEGVKSFRTGFEKALKRAGIENFTFHDLRHTFASHLVMSGVDIRTVQQLLGHKDIKNDDEIFTSLPFPFKGGGEKSWHYFGTKAF